MLCLLCSSPLEEITIFNDEFDNGIGRSLIVYLFPNLKVSQLKKERICDDCLNEFQKMKLFKLRCLDVEEKVKKHRESFNRKIVDLEDMLKIDGNINPGDPICRTCCHSIEEKNIVFLDNYHASIISNFLPELDLDAVKKPVLCTNCAISLNKMNEVHHKCSCSVHDSTCNSRKEKRSTQTRNRVVKDSHLVKFHMKHVRSCSESLDSSSSPVNSTSESQIIDTHRKVSDPADTELVNDIPLKAEASEDVMYEDSPHPRVMEQNSSSEKSSISFSIKSVLFKRNKLTKLFHCPCCQYSSKWQQDFKRHYLIYHDRNYKPFTCTLCDYLTKRKTELSRHIKTEHDDDFVPFECSQCSYQSKWKSSLNRHIRMEHDQNVKIFNCSQCSFSTKLKRSLKQHSESNHKENRMVYECPHCPFAGVSDHYFRDHLRRHQESDKMHECVHCDFKTKWRQYLTKHIRLKHTDNQKTYECFECHYRTKFRGCIIQHIKNIHRKPIFKCEHCLYKTKCRKIFERHIKLRHERDSLRFCCNICKFKTDRATMLGRHIETRHNKKPMLFKCSQCSQTMKTKQSLKEHLKMMHGPKVELLPCSHCDFKTKWKKVLDRHVRLKHDSNCEKIKCPYSGCKHETKLRSNLKIHLKFKHKNERDMHLCAFCKFVTITAGGLRKHVKDEHTVNSEAPVDVIDSIVKSEVKLEYCDDDLEIKQES